MFYERKIELNPYNRNLCFYILVSRFEPSEGSLHRNEYRFLGFVGI
jgi:hypothetical protein